MHQADKNARFPALAKINEQSLQAMKKPELVHAALTLAGKLKAREGEIAALGDSAVFIRRDPAGKTLRSYRAEVKLNEANKELATIQSSPMITANGATKLNQIANLQVLTPPTVVVDGIEQHNPYIERDTRTRAIKSVWIRRVAFGPSPTGNMVAVDSTLYFNVYTYFLQDLQAKIKKHPMCGTLGVEGQKPAEITYQPKKWQQNPGGKGGRYVNDGQPKTIQIGKNPMAFYSIEPPVGLWVDLSHPEIQAAFNEHVSRQKFGERHARSICTRNVLLEHPAIAAKTVATGKETRITVYGWRHDMTLKDINEMSTKVVEGEVDDKDINVIQTGTKEVTPEDVAAATATEVDEFGEVVDVEATESRDASEPSSQGETVKQEQSLPEEQDQGGEKDIWDEMGPQGEQGQAGDQFQGKNSSRQELITQILEAMEIAGAESVQDLLKKEFEGKKIEQLTKAQLTVLDRKVNGIIDQSLA